MAFNTRNRGGNNSFGRRRKSAISDINITPLVDVLLVLLIIFMVAAPMMTGSVELDLPKGASEAEAQKTAVITVSIKDDGTIYLQDDPVKMRVLPKMLLEITNNDLNSKIYVRADQRLDYGRVMEIVRVINTAGFTQVVLVTEMDAN